jgi:hypothetical protein
MDIQGESGKSEKVKRPPPPGSQAHCAAVLGFSPAYFSKLKSAGRITSEPDGTWSPDSVRAQIEATRDPGNVLATAVRAQFAAPAEAKAAAVVEVAALSDDLTTAQVDALYGPDHKQNLLIARSLKEREQAAQERINRLNAEGSLVLLEDVKRESFTAARATRDAVLRAVTKVAPLLAPITDPWELERRLADAMRAALLEATTDAVR